MGFQYRFSTSVIMHCGQIQCYQGFFEELLDVSYSMISEELLNISSDANSWVSSISPCVAAPPPRSGFRFPSGEVGAPAWEGGFAQC